MAAVVIVVGLFALLFLFPEQRDFYLSNFSWLFPLIVAVFVAPVGVILLNQWDIHFSIEASPDKLIAILENTGTTPFNFNRVQFASGKEHWVFGSRTYCPADGIYHHDVEFHGGDVPTQSLHEHTGCTLRQGMPITLTIRDPLLKQHLESFGETQKIRICLYYHGTEHRAFSQAVRRRELCKTAPPSPD